MANAGDSTHQGGIDRDAHRTWLETLAAEDRLRRAAATPEIDRKEALLRAERERLQRSQAAVGALEAALDEVRAPPDDPGVA